MSKRGAKIREQVLKVLKTADSALSAYDVLYALQVKHPKIAPPTVYRALAVLAKSGRVHRVESLKAYIACQHGSAHETSVLSICDDCGSIHERAAPELVEDISGFVKETGFAPQRHVIEVHGICSDCGSNTQS